MTKVEPTQADIDAAGSYAELVGYSPESNDPRHRGYSAVACEAQGQRTSADLQSSVRKANCSRRQVGTPIGASVRLP